MTLHRLYESISLRWRPEDVASAIRTLGDHSLSAHAQRLLGSVWGTYSSMPASFDSAVNLEAQIRIAQELFPDVPAPESAQSAPAVRAYLDGLQAALGITGTNFLSDRLARPLRHDQKIKFASRRAYNKRFRLVRRMEAKYTRWLRVSEIKDLARVSKTLLAYRITWDDFKRDRATACFVAWITSRMGLRSQFTWGKQTRAYDRIADALFMQLGPDANWKIIAMVYPTTEVLAHLTEAEQGELLGDWFSVMERSAKILSQMARSGRYDLRELIVRRGNDSSTWNEAAGAFNKARTGWINTLHALGAESVLDALAPGKALRLMAADVVYMHRRFGSGGLEPDTLVWNELPKPWDVIQGRKRCTQKDIARACIRHGSVGKGWIAPRAKSVARFTPTPELVHGVTVTSPRLAETLRRAGYFAGPSKGVRRVVNQPLTREQRAAHVVIDDR